MSELNGPKIIISTSTYNVEKYILKALDSVYHQTYKNWEWILIENASTDRTASIIEKYLKHHPDVRIHYFKYQYNSLINQEACEQTPEFKACQQEWQKYRGKGCYFTTLDSDDYFEYDALETMVKPVIEHNVDYVITGRKGFADGNPNSTFTQLPVTKVYNDMADMSENWIQNYPCIRTVWCKLFRLDWYLKIEDENIDDIRSWSNGNDTMRNLCYLFYMEPKVASVGKVTVNFCVRHSSIFNTNVYPERYLAYKIIFEKTVKLFQKWNRVKKENLAFARCVLSTSMVETVSAASRDIFAPKSLQLIKNIVTDSDIFEYLAVGGMYDKMAGDIFALLLTNGIEDKNISQQAYGYFHIYIYKSFQLLKNKYKNLHAILCLLLTGVLHPDNRYAVGLDKLLESLQILKNDYFVALAQQSSKLRDIKQNGPIFFRSLLTKDEELGKRTFLSNGISYYNVYSKTLEAFPEDGKQETVQHEKELIEAIGSGDLQKVSECVAHLEKLCPFGMTTLYGKMFLLCSCEDMEQAFYVAMVVPHLFPNNSLMMDTAASIFEYCGFYEFAAHVYTTYLRYSDPEEQTSIQERINELTHKNEEVEKTEKI